MPVSPTNKELFKVSGAIQAIDTLRRVRNDLVHGNISENDINSVSLTGSSDLHILRPCLLAGHRDYSIHSSMPGV